MNWIKEIPSWVVLFVLLSLLMLGYYVRPDNVTEDSFKAVLGALLLSLQTKPKPPEQNP